MCLNSKLKALGSTVAAFLLIAITIVAGLAAFYFFRSTSHIEAQKVQVEVESENLVRSVIRPKIIFALTLKNTGNKPVILLTVRLHNESDYTVPSVSSTSPLEPGKSAGVRLTEPTIHEEYYVVGNFYVFLVKAKAEDGSEFAHLFSVVCTGFMGFTGEGENGGLMHTATFIVHGVHTVGVILTVDGATYTPDLFGEGKPLTFHWPVGSSHSFEWSDIVEFGSQQAGSRYKFSYFSINGSYSGFFAAQNFGQYVAAPGEAVIEGFYHTQHTLNVSVSGYGRVLINSLFTGSFEVAQNATFWFKANSTVTALPVTMYPNGFKKWILDGGTFYNSQLLVNMTGPRVLQAFFGSDILISVHGDFSSITGGNIMPHGAIDPLAGINMVPWGANDPIVGVNFVPWGSYDLASLSYRWLFLEVVCLPGTSPYDVTVTPEPGWNMYVMWTNVLVTAETAPSVKVVNWTLDGKRNLGSGSFATVLMDANHTLKLYIGLRTRYSLTITVDDPNKGSTTPAPGTYHYYEGETATVEAHAYSGNRFLGWLLDGATALTDNPVTLVMDRNHQLMARFSEDRCIVTFEYAGLMFDVPDLLVVDGVTYGSTSFSGGKLQFNWLRNTIHDFEWKASALQDGAIGEWTSTSGLSTKRFESINVTGDGSVAATYSTKYMLTITVVGYGSTTPPPGEHWIPAGVSQEVAANPNVGYTVKAWAVDGAAAGSQNKITVLMNAPHSVTVEFVMEDFSYLADKLGVIAPTYPTPVAYISPFPYVASYIEDSDVRRETVGIVLTYRVWSDLGGWNSPSTVSLGDDAVINFGRFIEISDAYIMLSNGERLPIKYNGHDVFYLYYDNTSFITRATETNPVGR